MMVIGIYRMDAAVRITHKPTGISAEVWGKRSQHRNRQAAMDLLRARIYASANVARLDVMVRGYDLGDGDHGLPDAEVDALIDAPRIAPKLAGNGEGE
jgi:hypothetical protein